MTFIPITEVVKFVDRVKAGSPNTLRMCPVCWGSGELDTPSNMGPGVPKCPVCKGTGCVDLARICCCGGPALFTKDGVVYCGRDMCLTVMRHKRTSGFGI